MLGLREENEDIYAWNAGSELLPGEVPTIAKAEPIDVAPGYAETAGKADSAVEAEAAQTAGSVTDGSVSYTPVQIKALEARIAALEDDQAT